MIVTFHIGPGYKTYEGEKTLQDVIRNNSDVLFTVNRDNRGKFCKPYLTDCGGSVVCDTPKAEVGCIDFDGDYDMYICRYIEDCTDDELGLIARDGGYKSPELQDYIKNNYIE